MKHKGIDYKTSAIQYYLNNNEIKTNNIFVFRSFTLLLAINNKKCGYINRKSKTRKL
jgi:hypothetical protein